jgi:hypothetical protein
VITVNIYRNMGEAFQTFDYISTNANWGWVSREAGARRAAGQEGGSVRVGACVCAVCCCF